MRHEEKKLEEELAELAPLLSAYERSDIPHPKPPAGYWESALRRVLPASAPAAPRRLWGSRLAWAAAASVVLIVSVWGFVRYRDTPEASGSELTAALAAEYLDKELLYLDAEQLESLAPVEDHEDLDALWDKLIEDLSEDEIHDLF
ncbi:MAG: hypothetical protein ACK4NS_04515 [Saprospiraceae bacterium]